MKKIIPFKKDIIFKTNLSEITSISLEHTLHAEKDNLITGEFIISGEYKMADDSVNTEAFSFNLPFDINMDNKYILNNVILDIDDFYYEIINNNVLAVNIDVMIDKLEEKPLMEQKEIFSNSNDQSLLDDLIETEGESEMKEEELNFVRNDYNDEEPIVPNKNNNMVSAKSLFDNLDNSSETYTTYKIYMVKEGDSIEVILQKYGIGKEELEKYNDLNEITIGDKLIIPSLVNEKN